MNTLSPMRRDRRLRAIARQIIRHGFTAREVAQSLARSALEYAEANIGEAARSLGLDGGDVTALTEQAAQSILSGNATADAGWQPNHGGLPVWPTTEQGGME